MSPAEGIRKGLGVEVVRMDAVVRRHSWNSLEYSVWYGLGSRERGDPDAGRGDLDDNWRGSARLRPSGSREGFGDRREGFGDRRVDPADEVRVNSYESHC